MKSDLLKVMSEAAFLAGEDARGVLVILEPETALSDEHLDALRDCGAAGFISDLTLERFEKPDVVPTLDYDRARHAALRAFAVSPRQGVRLRTLSAAGGLRVEVGEDGSLTPVPPPAAVKRDRSKDPEVDKGMILKALAEVGVRKGDILMVHSSLSACGRIVGGAQTVIEALVESVGEDGNLFFPSYQRSECFLNGAISKRWDHRPGDTNDRSSNSMKWIGAIPLEFMRLYPNAPRGRHLSHAWTGWGKRAAEILSHQEWNEAPFSDNSAPYQVMLAGGRILHFGSPLGRTSFMHCLETHYELPGYGSPAFFEYRLPSGEIAWTATPYNFCGARLTTTLNGDAPFYREAVAEGLRIDEAALGVGKLRLMDARSFWEIGSKVFKRNPLVNLAKAV